MEEGVKFDLGKLEYGLLPPLALEETVKVLTFGAQKYARDNWQLVPDSKRRYFDALQRHVWAWKRGESLDPESGIHHLAHAMCCLMFLYEHDVKYSNNTNTVESPEVVLDIASKEPISPEELSRFRVELDARVYNFGPWVLGACT